MAVPPARRRKVPHIGQAIWLSGWVAAAEDRRELLVGMLIELGSAGVGQVQHVLQTSADARVLRLGEGRQLRPCYDCLDVVAETAGPLCNLHRDQCSLAVFQEGVASRIAPGVSRPRHLVTSLDCPQGFRRAFADLCSRVERVHDVPPHGPAGGQDTTQAVQYFGHEQTPEAFVRHTTEVTPFTVSPVHRRRVSVETHAPVRGGGHHALDATRRQLREGRQRISVEEYPWVGRRHLTSRSVRGVVADARQVVKNLTPGHESLAERVQLEQHQDIGGRQVSYRSEDTANEVGDKPTTGATRDRAKRTRVLRHAAGRKRVVGVRGRISASGPRMV